VKACIFLIILLLSPLSVEARQRLTGVGAVLTAEPGSAKGHIHKNRGPASVQVADANRELFSRLNPGDRAIIQNSIHELDDEVVEIVDKFEDGQVRVKRANGKIQFVRAKNLALTLSPEVECGDSHGTKICKGDTVFYPVRISSLNLPEAEVSHIFENGAVVIRDGGVFVFELKQVGKPSRCSPQKESTCMGDYVYASGFRDNRSFEFEGPVEKAYTNGVVIVRVNGLWRYPIDVHATKRRIASTAPDELSPAVITTHGTRGKDLPYPITPEIEPLDPVRADKVLDAR
jgi:hypothetical protein